MSSSEPALRVSGVTVRFGGVVAVDRVDLDVAPGEIVGVIGPNGAGKTTLLDAVSGFVTPTEGTVALDGYEVTRALPYVRARRGLGRSFQDARLFPSLTVRETLLGAFHPSLASGAVAEGLRLPGAKREEATIQQAVESLLDVVDLERYLDHRIADSRSAPRARSSSRGSRHAGRRCSCSTSRLRGCSSRRCARSAR